MPRTIDLQRFLFRIPAPRIGRAEALRLAKAECRRQGWEFREVWVIEELRFWRICVSSDHPPLYGGTPPMSCIEIDNQTGAVLSSRVVEKDCH
ncbi:MAG TPA: hypothetical protein VEI97_17215 [bacterium]|nr:hypothetical protein [bacterium]